MAEKKSFWDSGFGAFVNNILFGLPSAIAGWIGSSRLTGAEREQNAFNAQQAQLQRDFEADQAARMMDFQSQQVSQQLAFQENMASTQYQRAVKDMQVAGVNPALAMSQGGNVAPSGVSASGAMASGVAASGSGRGMPFTMSEIMAALRMRKEIKLLDEQAKNVAADTANKQEDTAAKTIANEIARKFGMAQAEADLNNSVETLQLIKSQISETDMRALYEFAESELANANKDFVLTEKYAKEWENAFIERFHVSPALAGQLIQSLSNLGSAAIHGLFSRFGLGLLLK